MATKAGEGEHSKYFIKAPNANFQDTANFEPRKHYVGIDIVRWYINKQGGWFKDRMASGTSEITLADEKYQAAIGLYQLEGGARTAPSFDKPIIPNRIYRGGMLSIRVFIQALEKDNLLSSLLKDMAIASLGVIAGAITTATAAGPTAILLAAGKSIVGGAENILKEGKNVVPVLDPSGVDVNIDLGNMTGRENYLLVHRGRKLDLNRLSFRIAGHTVEDVLYDSHPLDDGAWILIRLRREDNFGSPRPWRPDAQKVVTEIDNLIDRFSTGDTNEGDAIALLKVTGGEPETIGDKVEAVKTKIRNDFALTDRERLLESGKVKAYRKIALKAIQKNDESLYWNERKKAAVSLTAGVQPPKLFASVLSEEALKITESFSHNYTGETPELSGDTLWRTLRYAGVDDIASSIA